ncbi:MAG: ankyrin repeat domain-containing protein [Trinickia sp.]|uniref:ankyrin repeat domain-containing protein n=1 Tax=Trinickia sp. TaxID=2571163 RepID=UPI003F804892
MHHAIQQGQTEAVACLLRLRADASIRDTGGWRPLALAEAHGHVAIVELLRAAGASSSESSDDEGSQDASDSVSRSDDSPEASPPGSPPAPGPSSASAEPSAKRQRL